MPHWILLISVLLLLVAGYYIGRQRALSISKKGGNAVKLHSTPGYYGALTALWCGIPAMLIFGLWLMFEQSFVTHLILATLPAEISDLPRGRLDLFLNEVRNLATSGMTAGDINPVVQTAADQYRRVLTTSHAALAVVVLCVAIAGIVLVFSKIKPDFRARNRVEQIMLIIMIICSTIAIFTTIGIVLSVLFEAIRFFKTVPVIDFLFGLEWSPQMAIRADQVGSSGAFGAVPVFTGTLLISAIAMLVAVPIGLLSAVYLSEYAGRTVRAWAKPLMEILAGIPTVVYGFFAALTVAPFIRDAGAMLGLSVASGSALAAGLVMGIMIIPFVSSISDDVINAVPQSLRDGAYALGATQSETVKQVILPAALPGIVGGVLLAVSRAIGETMIVVMAAGLAANLTANPLQAVTTVTVQIVTLLVGDQEFDSPKTLAAFALGLVLFVATLLLNIVALHIVRKYREQYE
jgi:phosphate transport system permease protein